LFQQITSTIDAWKLYDILLLKTETNNIKLNTVKIQNVGEIMKIIVYFELHIVS